MRDSASGLEEREQPLLGAHPAEPHESGPAASAHGRVGGERGVEHVVVDAVPDDVDVGEDAVRLEPRREVRGRRRDGVGEGGEALEVGPAIAAERRGLGERQHPPSPAVERRHHDIREGRGRRDPDIHPVVHRVHGRQAVPACVSVPREGTPEIGLHVDDVHRGPALQGGVDESIRAPARPRHGVLPVHRHRDGGRVDVGLLVRALGQLERRAAGLLRPVHARRHDGHRVAGALQEAPLQPHRDLRPAE